MDDDHFAFKVRPRPTPPLLIFADFAVIIALAALCLVPLAAFLSWRP